MTLENVNHSLFALLSSGGERYLLTVGSDFIARFYRLSINDHEIFLRELGLAVSIQRMFGRSLMKYLD